MAAIVDYGYIRQTWLALASLIPNEIGRAALMGNWYAESHIIPYCIQGNVAPPWTPSVNYTNKVDSGEYSKNNFVYDQKGYGFAQWTSSGRKLGLYNLREQMAISIGALELGIAFATEELTGSYRSTLDVLLNATDFRSASDYVLHNYEKPQDQGIGAQETRADYSEQIYDSMHGILPPEIKVLIIDPISASIVDGESIRITVNANSEWTYNIGQYLTATKEDNALIVSGNANGAQVTSVVNFWLLDSQSVTAQCQIGINRPAPPTPEINVTPYSQQTNVGTVVRFNVRCNYDWGVSVPNGAELVKKERGYCYIKVNVTALRKIIIRFFVLSDTNIYQECTINISGVAPIPSARKTPFIYYLKPFLGKGR